MTFDPPGFLDDLNAAQKQAWDRQISAWLDDAKAGNPGENDGPRAQFFNPEHNPPAADAVEEDIAWTAFPRNVQRQSASDRQRWRVADSSRDLQDEYCEWSVERANNLVKRVTFTCEGPEYWEFLAAVAPDKVVALYQEHVSSEVRREHLFQGGRYNRRNRWNNSTSEGAMHLIQGANTLTAEIELAGGASLQRANPDGTLKTGAAELIACSRYGDPERHSDPHIGDRVNAHARTRSDITLANPIGLYFAGIDTSSWTIPDGSDPDRLWRFTRGSNGKFLRLVVEPPAGAGFGLSEVEIAGERISFGGQIADNIRIKLTGLVTRIGQNPTQPTQGCRGAADGPALGIPSVADVLAAAADQLGRR